MAITSQANEAEEYTSFTGGDWRYNATGAGYDWNSAHARSSLGLYAGVATYQARQSLGGAKTTQCICGLLGRSDAYCDDATIPFLGFTSGGTAVLALQTTITTGVIKLVTWNGASWDVLATGIKPEAGYGAKLDMFLEDYGATSHVRVWLRYLDGAAPAALIIDFSGDCRASGITDVDGLFWTCRSESAGAHRTGNVMTEVISAAEPTMRLGVATLYPNEAGDELWEAGTYASVDEITPNFDDFIETATAGDKFLCGVTALPAGTITPLTFQVAILAAKGATGPTQIKLGIKTGGTEYWGSTETLTDVPACYKLLMTQNPVTVAAWTTAEINAIQIGVQAVA